MGQPDLPGGISSPVGPRRQPTGAWCIGRHARSSGAARGRLRYGLRPSTHRPHYRTVCASGTGNVVQQVGMASNFRRCARRFLLVMSSDELVMYSGMRTSNVERLLFRPLTDGFGSRERVRRMSKQPFSAVSDLVESAARGKAPTGSPSDVRSAEPSVAVPVPLAQGAAVVIERNKRKSTQ